MQDEQRSKETWNVSDGQVEKNEFTANSGLVTKDNSGVINYTVNNYGRQELKQQLENPNKSNFACSGQSPYQGLSPFLEEDAALFFGRNEKADSLYSLVQANPLTAVIGASGSGKSSLVYAGLLPRLRKEGWLIGSFRPKLQPFAELATALVRLMEPELKSVYEIDQASVLAKTLREEGGLYQALSILLNKHTNQKIILFIDQFEELFKLSSIEQKYFIDSLLNTLDRTLELKLVLTLRADFCEQVYTYPPLLNKLQKIEAGKVSSTDLKLGSMSKTELREVIECPTKDKAVFEPGLVEQILEDLGAVSGNLPLLEFALDELWKQGKLTLDAYRKIGGVREALAKRADAIYIEYERKNKGRKIEKIFRQLVAVSEDTADTRRIVIQFQIKDWDLVEELAAKRLLVIGQDERSKDRTVELIHEALIQEWQKLREWVNDKREDSIRSQRVESAAKEWKKNEKAVSYLWQQQRLQDAIKLLHKQNEIEPLSPLALEFIKKSKTEVRQKLILNFLIGIAFFCFIGGIVGYYSVQDNNRKLKQAALRGDISSEVFQAIPGWLKEVENKQRESKDVEAIAIARENARIMENWRKALQENPNKYPQPSIQAFLKQSEDWQVRLIQQYRLPKLERELKNNTTTNNTIGQLLPNADLSTGCEQYTKGALKTTCEIIFRDLGADDDPISTSQENSDIIPNIINTQEKAARMPCEVLIKIGELWRDNTKNKSCGWLGSQEDGLAEPSCKELDGRSLTDRIFAAPVNVPLAHLKHCLKS